MQVTEFLGAARWSSPWLLAPRHRSRCTAAELALGEQARHPFVSCFLPTRCGIRAQQARSDALPSAWTTLLRPLASSYRARRSRSRPACFATAWPSLLAGSSNNNPRCSGSQQFRVVHRWTPSLTTSPTRRNASMAARVSAAPVHSAVPDCRECGAARTTAAAAAATASGGAKVRSCPRQRRLVGLSAGRPPGRRTSRIRLASGRGRRPVPGRADAGGPCPGRGGCGRHCVSDRAPPGWSPRWRWASGRGTGRGRSGLRVRRVRRWWSPAPRSCRTGAGPPGEGSAPATASTVASWSPASSEQRARSSSRFTRRGGHVEGSGELGLARSWGLP